jgi:hypothetical protein
VLVGLEVVAGLVRLVGYVGLVGLEGLAVLKNVFVIGRVSRVTWLDILLLVCRSPRTLMAVYCREGHLGDVAISVHVREGRQVRLRARKYVRASDCLERGAV